MSPKQTVFVYGQSLDLEEDEQRAIAIARYGGVGLTPEGFLPE